MALIKCEECGQMVSDKAGRCPNCGCPIVRRIVCEECGQEMKETDMSCPSCGCPNPLFAGQQYVGAQDRSAQVQGMRYPSAQETYVPYQESGKSRTVFFVLAFFLGGLGIHLFYVNKVIAGVLNLLFCFTFIPCIIALIQSIIALTLTQEEFDRRYVYTDNFYPF